jgi:hypothetical protein
VAVARGVGVTVARGLGVAVAREVGVALGPGVADPRVSGGNEVVPPPPAQPQALSVTTTARVRPRSNSAM